MRDYIAKLMTPTAVLGVFLFMMTVGIGYLGAQTLNKSTATEAVASATTTCDPGITCVDLNENGASQGELYVVTGDYIQFNAKGDKHNLSSGEKSHEKGDLHTDHGEVLSFSSGDFAADEAWRVQFKKPGTYRLVDTYNKNIEILVVAYTPGGLAKIQ